MQIPEQQDPVLTEVLAWYLQAREDADLANERLKTAERHLLKHMEDRQHKTVRLNDGTRTFTATYTQRMTNQIDEKGLRKALRAKVYDKYTVRKLDRKALERAMTDGEVDPIVVARFVAQVPGETYLTYRVKDADEPQSV